MLKSIRKLDENFPTDIYVYVYMRTMFQYAVKKIGRLNFPVLGDVEQKCERIFSESPFHGKKNTLMLTGGRNKFVRLSARRLARDRAHPKDLIRATCRHWRWWYSC